MRRIDEGLAALAVHVAQLVLQRLAQFQVERGERFVEQEQFRAPHQRPRQRNALALSARNLVGVPIEQAGDAQIPGGAHDARFHLVFRRAIERGAQREGDVVEDG